jgi:DNA-binding PadR family transcriptional regulator
MSDVLGTFEQAVLLAVVRLRSEAYGRAILKEVQTRLDRDVAAGAIYATLDRLEEKGLLASRLEPGTPIRGGKPRRYYAVGAVGVRALNDARATLDDLWRGLSWPLKGRV